MLADSLRSVSGMLQNRELYEALVQGSTLLSERALRLESWTARQDDEVPLIVRYAHVILCFRAASEALHRVITVVQQAMEGETVSSYDLQLSLRHFLIDLDSTLDYLEKFLQSLQSPGKVVPFAAGENWRNQLRVARNQVVHDKAPLVCVSRGAGSVSHADVAAPVEGGDCIRFRLERSADGATRWYTPWELQSLLLEPVKALLERVTAHLLAHLGE